MPRWRRMGITDGVGAERLASKVMGGRVEDEEGEEVSEQVGINIPPCGQTGGRCGSEGWRMQKESWVGKCRKLTEK